jgi:hypothetical protein
MTTDERIETLEKGLASARRFNRWLLAAVGLALGVWILAGTFGPTIAAAPAGGGAVKEVRAREFILEDENGNNRARLSMGNDGPTLALFDEKGKNRAKLSAFKDGPGLYLFDENGKPRAVLSAFKDGPGLNLADENSKGGVMLIADKNGPALILYDENGKVMWQASNPTAPAGGAAASPDTSGTGLSPVERARGMVSELSREGKLGGMVGDTWVGPGAGDVKVTPDGKAVWVPKGPDVATQIRMAENQLKLAQTKAALAATQAQAGVPAVGGAVREVRTNRLIIEDENGKVRAMLATDKDGPVLGLLDERGQVRAWLNVVKDGPAMFLYDENRRPIWRAP